MATKARAKEIATALRGYLPELDTPADLLPSRGLIMQAADGLDVYGNTPNPPPPIDPPPAPQPGVLMYGELPSDGFKTTSLAGIQFLPNLKHGQRVSGTIVVGVTGPSPANIAAIPHRLLVDGIPQPSCTVDTTRLAIGPHVFAIQITSASPPAGFRNGSVVVVVNNSNLPYEQNEQVVIGQRFQGHNFNSLAWGRVTCVAPRAYPLTHSDDNHPDAKNDTDRQRLANEFIWWVEGLVGQCPGLWEMMPILFKNQQGDWCVDQWNPQTGSTSIVALPYVEASPQYDGQRGICTISPYSTLIAGRGRVLSSGHTGWLAVDLSGRIMDVDITGEVTTIFGPRSKAGVVGTSPLENKTLAARIRDGEKEFVGDQSGGTLRLAQDIWQCSTVPHIHAWIADTGNNRVAEYRFADKKIGTSDAIAGVTSVWSSLPTQQTGAAWWAAAPDGLWRKSTTAAGGALQKVADIPGAHWVRGFGDKVYVFTLRGGLFEYDSATMMLTTRIPDSTTVHPFVFADVDVNGSCGPTGRIYFSNVTGAAKTRPYYIDPPNWTPRLLDLYSVNRQTYGSEQVTTDKFGHYLWLFACHDHMPKFVSGGITDAGLKLWSGHLGPMPVADPGIPDAGRNEFKFGIPDERIPLSVVFGYRAHGMIGFSVDDFRDLKTWTEARPVMRAALDPLFHPSETETERDAVARHMFAQRTRKHFQ